MSNKLNTEFLNQSNSCFIHALTTSELASETNQGNQLLNIDNPNIISTGLAEEPEQEPEQEQQIARPILKRGVHINECLDNDPLSNCEDSELLSNCEDDDDEAKEQRIEHDLEQQRPDLVWSDWANRLITKKDFETFMGFVEPIVKSIIVTMDPVKDPVEEPEKEKLRVNLLQLLLSRYRMKAVIINEIIMRQMKEKEATKEATKEEEEEEATKEEEELDDFCESDHEDMKEEYEKEDREEKEQNESTFTNFNDLSDCFETKEENEDNDEEEEEQMPPLEDHVCSKLQAELNQIQISFENPIWEEEYELNKARIIKTHSQHECNCCPPPPLPKKLDRLF